MADKTFHGIPREKILWNPSIDPETCIGCGECLDVCANGVFELSESSGKATVKDPMNCVVLCDKCAILCPAQAITFPDKEATQKLLTQLFRSRKEISSDQNESASSTSKLELL